MLSHLPANVDQLRGQRILVFGDVILDRYTWGNADRVSPEAPVLILRADNCEVRAGGAASVATLLAHLDAEVTLVGVVGDDANGRTLRSLLDELSIDSRFLHTIPSRPTTTKERFLGRAAGRHTHQVLRVDYEVDDDIALCDANRLQDALQDRLAVCDAVILSDYNKGACTVELLELTLRAARARGLPTVVDPARVDDYSRYRGASVITPNRSEAALVTGRPLEQPHQGLEAGQSIAKQFEISGVLVTMDRDGIAVVDTKTGFLGIDDARPRPIYDITGAGDMVVAIAALCQGAGMSLQSAAQLANVAAGLEVERVGVTPISWQEIREAVGTSQSGHAAVPPDAPLKASASKIITTAELTALVAGYRSRGQSIVFTNGCFDLLHAGHVTYLEQAATLGDVLIVALNSDRSVRNLKGADRPVIQQEHRGLMLAALSSVDHVVVFEDPTPHELLRVVRPDVLVKGGTYTREEVVGHEIVDAYGGRVCVTDRFTPLSTTNLVQAIRET